MFLYSPLPKIPPPPILSFLSLYCPQLHHKMSDQAPSRTYTNLITNNNIHQHYTITTATTANSQFFNHTIHHIQLPSRPKRRRALSEINSSSSSPASPSFSLCTHRWPPLQFCLISLWITHHCRNVHPSAIPITRTAAPP